MSLQGKHILLGISGGIAAYKSVFLLRMLMKEGAEVQVILTPNAKEFVTPLTLSTLSRKPVISEFFSRRDGSWNSHVELGLWADLMLVAPATASTIAKMANGVADNMLITTFLSCKAPVFVAPAMDLDMYKHPTTQHNLGVLQSFLHIIDPEEGFLASGLEGKGRMAEPETIVNTLKTFFEQSKTLQGKNVLITAGPTYERIDPVRFIGNYSSGKMGFALAEECAERGAKVTLITGPVKLTTQHKNILRINIESANEMYEMAMKYFPQADIAILSAAVADFTIAQREDNKIKRGKENLQLTLVPTKDIASALGKLKRKNQKLIGFALETQEEEKNAFEKLKRKNFDFIVLNSLNDKGAGFLHDTNKISILDKENNIIRYPLKTKIEVAKDIVDYLGK
ncbi:MAG TPA: bifunctional phosphopantothenoylcysteine decarboxylase/phosphopantothenate--cysteine ligase CoaBC [Porphyromonadaceae bacterium]|nr:bifunctional phosphopantothenoylcysteine decarboxylase/phosphopantothenate--cysteine ligase CoaBC [Porphyromonadaceae bacterium]